MAVIVTRPADEAARWIEALRGRGIAAVPLPLIAIGAPPDPASLQRARDELARFDAVMFVSGNAVRGLLAPGAVWPAGVRAWAPGPGTAATLQECGVPPDSIDQPTAASAQFDSEALWSAVAPRVRAGDRVLLVRGAGEDGQARGREWLAQQLAAAGAQVETVAGYARQLPQWSPSQREQASQALADGSLWLFSSSEAVANLARLLPHGDRSTARALATHPRIAEAARAAGFGTVRECRPALADVVASIEFPR